MSRRLRIFLLADHAHPAFSIIDHIDAYLSCSRHDVIVVNPILNRLFPKFLFDFADVIAIHYSLYLIRDFYLSGRLRAAIRDFKGLKVQFVQDEYRHVNATSEMIADFGADVLFTLVRPDLVERAYNHPRLQRVEKISVLPGYVSDSLARRSHVPVTHRKIDIGYRSRRVPYWLGDLGQDKTRIAEGVLRLAPQHGLTCNISVEESDRIYGEQWIGFLESCKVVLGTEGGSSIWDYDGHAQRDVENYLRRRPGASYEEVAREVLATYEGNLMYNTMSPRLFEAAALRTPMVMFRGWYDGVVEAGRHYIPLEKDFSNFAEVAAKIRDDAYLQAMADRTYDDLVASGKYSKRSFMAKVDDAIEAAIERRGQGAVVVSGAPEARPAVSSALLRRIFSAIQLASVPVVPLVLAWRLVRRIFDELRRGDRTLGERLVEARKVVSKVPHFVYVFTLGAMRARMAARRLRHQNAAERSRRV